MYLAKAMVHLGDMFEYALMECGIPGDRFVDMFAASTVAARLEQGDPSYLVGRCGIELACEVIREATGDQVDPAEWEHYSRTAAYWAGWAICYYQWRTALSYRRIFSMVRYGELLTLYPTYHEADIEKFASLMDGFYARRVPEKNLKRIRQAYGCSQRELSEASGVSLRSIQMYEQGQKDINKGQAGTVRRLARVLGCRMEDLLEMEV